MSPENVSATYIVLGVRGFPFFHKTLYEREILISVAWEWYICITA